MLRRNNALLLALLLWLGPLTAYAHDPITGARAVGAGIVGGLAIGIYVFRVASKQPLGLRLLAALIAAAVSYVAAAGAIYVLFAN